nr:putative disease resistance protein rpp1 [Quercus suber]
MESLPNEWASNLNFLKNLVIINCPGLSSLSRAMQYLTSLEELWITNCDEFKSLSDIDDDDGMEWRHLNCLRSLRFESLLKLESLPAGLQHVATLQKLIISACPNLISLPEWICELTSLEHLVIARCASKLTSLPAGISCLTSLRFIFYKCYNDQLNNSLSCFNIRNHLLSVDDLKNLEHFYVEYGRKMYHLETIRISDADVVKILGYTYIIKGWNG